MSSSTGRGESSSPPPSVVIFLILAALAGIVGAVATLTDSADDTASNNEETTTCILCAESIPDSPQDRVDIVESWTFWLIVIVGVFTYGFFFLTLYRFHHSKKVKKGGHFPHKIGPVPTEFLWIAIPTVIIFTLTAFSASVLNDMLDVEPIEQEPDVVYVDVSGSQWSWSFEYQDGTTSDELWIQEGSTVVFNITAPEGDVLHAFFLPDFGIKADAFPGEVHQLWLIAEPAGEYEIKCAEYCGTAHASMRTTFNIFSEDDRGARENPWGIRPAGQVVVSDTALTVEEGLEANLDEPNTITVENTGTMAATVTFGTYGMVSVEPDTIEEFTFTPTNLSGLDVTSGTFSATLTVIDRPTVEYWIEARAGSGDNVFEFVGVNGTIAGIVNPNLNADLNDRVIIHLSNSDSASHNIEFAGYDIETPLIAQGGTAVLAFVADEPGEFPYYFCNVPTHREAGMEGQLIVAGLDIEEGEEEEGVEDRWKVILFVYGGLALAVVVIIFAFKVEMPNLHKDWAAGSEEGE